MGLAILPIDIFRVIFIIKVVIKLFEHLLKNGITFLKQYIFLFLLVNIIFFA